MVDAVEPSRPKEPFASRASRVLRSWHFWVSLGILLVVFIVLISLRVDLQWFWLLLYAALIIPFAPYVRDAPRYFRGGLDDNAKSSSSLLLLAASASISWVFAKSILNSSLLGGQYGVVGALAYACYYTSFASVAIVIYFLRTRRGYRSLPEAIAERYGTLAAVSFGLAVLFRLYQEVWSNALVVAGFYGDTHSRNWWLGACLSTLIPVIYSFTGGMRASVMTDTGQILVCIGFLIALMGVLGAHRPTDFVTWNPSGTCALPDAPSYLKCAADGGAIVSGAAITDASHAVFTYANATCSYRAIPTAELCRAAAGAWKPAACTIKAAPACVAAGGAWTPRAMWTLEGGLDILTVALLQLHGLLEPACLESSWMSPIVFASQVTEAFESNGCLSYPFFDPVLTDRAFLAEPRTMLAAFLLGGAIAATFIFLFGFVGIFGNATTTLRPATVPAAIFQAMRAGQPSAVARFFGTAMFSVVNIIFITESLSTLDSTFTSAAKLFGPEGTGLLENGRPSPPQTATRRHLLAGRCVIVVLAVVGILPLLARLTALDATTVSGTVVMGLGPPVYALLWVDGYRPLTFHLPFWWGVGMGTVFQLSSASCCKATINAAAFAIGHGDSALLLGFNVIGTVVAWVLMAATLLENPAGRRLREAGVGQENEVHVGRWGRGRGEPPREAELIPGPPVKGPEAIAASPPDVERPKPDASLTSA